MRKSIYILLLLLLSIGIKGQGLVGYEYWFDSDYQNKVSVTDSQKEIQLSPDASLLQKGIHYFNFRVQDSRGKWSSILTRYFYRTSSDNIADNALVSYEYWMDGNYAERKVTANTGGIINVDIDASKLPHGIHYFNFRAKDKMGNYSALITQYFYRMSSDNIADNALVSYEYWLDSNYSEKEEVPNADGIISLDVDASKLRKGMHYFNFRAKDKMGNYSSLVTQYFMKPLVGVSDNKICQYRYWFNDNGETLQKVDITPVNPLELSNALIEVPNLIPAEIPDDIQMATGSSATKKAFLLPLKMQIKLQFKDLADQWSVVQTDSFEHNSQVELEIRALTVNKAQTLKKPASKELVGFSIDVTKEDSLYWQADQPCMLDFFSPSGEKLCRFSTSESLKGKKIETKQKGIYYVLLHSTIHDETYNKDKLTIIGIGNNVSDTIEVNPAGTLPELVSDPEVIVNLTLTGYLNGTDIRFIRSLPRLAKLDISGAHIVEGGDTYYENYRTADEVTGDYMFSDLPKLTRLVLSNTTITLGKKALYGCTGLTELSIPHSITTFGEKAIGGTQGNLLLIHWNTPAAIASATFDTPEEMGNCLIYALQKTECTYEGNVIINGLADKIRLTDAKGFRCPTAFKAKDISYTRTFSMTSGNKEAAAGWESIVLPFDVQTFSHAEKGELAPFNSGKERTHPFWLAELSTEEGFRHVTELKANIPYIISMPNSDAYEEEFNICGNVTFHAENDNGVEVRSTYSSAIVRSEGPQFTLVPAYETVWQHDSVYVINRTISNGNLPGGAFVRNLRNANPFEAYAVSKDSPNQAPAYYSIGTNGSLTGLESLLRRTEESLKVYSIGRTLYIETNRAITLPIYDREGRTVRIIKAPEGRTEITDLLDGIYFSGGRKVMIGR